MTEEEIEKLKKKVEKDPLSSLVVPLADEYRKKGMIDEAIEILSKSIESRPDYTSARVTLGKIYLDRGMLPEARNEFEKVIEGVPDNLLAHKRLADIYQMYGEYGKAIEECRTILKLHPADEAAEALLQKLHSAKGKTGGATPPPSGKQTQKSGAGTEPEREDIHETAPPGEVSQEQDETRGKDQDNEKEGVPVYEISGNVNGSDLGIAIPEKLKAVSEEPASRELEEFRHIVEKTEDGSIAEDTGEEDEKAGTRHGPAPDVGRVLEKDKIVVSMPTETMADIFITQGFYDKALDIYTEILSADPENKKIVQKYEELKMLMKIKAMKDKVND